MGDRGEGGVKNLKMKVTSFMDTPIVQFIVLLYTYLLAYYLPILGRLQFSCKSNILPTYLSTFLYQCTYLSSIVIFKEYIHIIVLPM